MGNEPGPTHHNYKHGRYSKLNLQGDLARRLAEADADPQLLDLRRDVALIQARIDELLEELDIGASLELCQSVSKLLAAITDGDADKLKSLIPIVREQNSRTGRKQRSWREVERLVHTRRRLIRDRESIMVRKGQTLLASQAVVLLDRFLNIVIANVTDPNALRPIVAEYRAIVGVQDSRSSGAGTGGAGTGTAAGREPDSVDAC